MTNSKVDIIKYLDDFMQSDVYKQQMNLLEEKKKTVKYGSNVVHINYYEHVLNDADLNEFAGLLKKVQLEISSYNKTGVVYNSLEDYTNMMSIALNDELTKNIVFGVVGNAVWDTIKTIAKTILPNTKPKKSTKIAGNKTTKKSMTFGISMSLDKNTGFRFRLDSTLTSKTTDKALDQIKEVVKKQTPNKAYDHPLFFYYDKKKNIWIGVNMLEDLRRKDVTKKSKARKKKK